eukprot:UN24593
MTNEILDGQTLGAVKEWDKELKTLVQQMWDKDPKARPKVGMLVETFNELYRKSRESLKCHFLLSHAPGDIFFASRLQASLQRKGYEVWKPDSRSVFEIIDGFRRSKRLLCILTKEYVNNDSCMSEYRECEPFEKRIEVVCPQTPENEGFKKGHQKRITMDDGEGYDDMVTAILDDLKRPRAYFCISYNQSNASKEELEFTVELQKAIEQHGFNVWKQKSQEDSEEWKTVAKESMNVLCLLNQKYA